MALSLECLTEMFKVVYTAVGVSERGRAGMQRDDVDQRLTQCKPG